jgi:putative hemolysin
MFLNKLIFLCIFSHATDSIVWNVEGKNHSIYFDEKLQVMLSSSCEKSPCGARVLAEEARKLNLNLSKEEVSKNPGSQYCHQLKGDIVLAKNERGSQNAFCQASDKTIVDLSSLANKQ